MLLFFFPLHERRAKDGYTDLGDHSYEEEAIAIPPPLMTRAAAAALYSPGLATTSSIVVGERTKKAKKAKTQEIVEI